MPNIDNNWKNKIKRKGLGKAPQEISSNLQAPEFTPRDNRFTGRTKQLGLRVKPEFLKRLKELALEEDVFIVEILEKALEAYENQRKEPKQSTKKLSDYVKVIERKKFPHPNENFTCDKCSEEFQNETAYSYDPVLGKLTKTYCSDCV